MKIITFAVLFVCLNGGQSQDTQLSTADPKLMIKRYQMECIEETRINPDVIIKIKYWRWNIAPNQKPLLKQWALCVLMKNKIMTKEGVYKIDVALDRVPLEERDIVEKQIDKCLTPKAIPAGDIALNYIKCFQRQKSNYSSVVSAFVD